MNFFVENCLTDQEEKLKKYYEETKTVKEIKAYGPRR